MTVISPFRAWRYTEKAARLDDLVTQPYDKITPAMRARYLALSPYNIVRIILGERRPSDSAGDNVYTRAARYLDDWVRQDILRQEPEPALYPYSQEFRDPDTGENLVRRGFIGLGPVAEYSEGIVHRHEQTLAGPKQDRLELLRHTHAHFGQIFMLYSDPAGEADSLLAEGPPVGVVTDEYEARHALWKISDEARIARIRELMSDKKLLIADGHHRYETALAFRKENPQAREVMMTFVSMHSPGLRILATHRVLSGLPDFNPEAFLRSAAAGFEIQPVNRIERLESGSIGCVTKRGARLLRPREQSGDLDVTVLHRKLLQGVLGISEEAVRREQHIRYVRGLEAAVREVMNGEAQIAFLLPPAKIEDVARISFAGGFMPQKSTDFYPKLLSGLTIYKLQESATVPRAPAGG